MYLYYTYKSYTCNACVSYTHVIHVYMYCKHVLQMYELHVQYAKAHHTCITCVSHMEYTCDTFPCVHTNHLCACNKSPYLLRLKYTINSLFYT